MWRSAVYDTPSARELAREAVRARPMAVLIAEDPLRIGHMPILWREREGRDALIGHIPLADPLSEAIREGEALTIVFPGPTSYVTPAWYGGPGLPTYNFVPVHARGRPRVLDEAELRAHLLELVDDREAEAVRAGEGRGASTPWRLDDLAHARMERLMPLIIGFEVPVEELEVKAKLGQNRPEEDRDTVAAGLEARDDGDDAEIARLMREALAREPSDRDAAEAHPDEQETT